MANTMTPSILVAPPSLLHPPFNESVIILAGHEKNGSLGFILNRPIGLTVHDIMDDQNKYDPFYVEKPIFFGGPVDNKAGFIMYEHSRGKALAPGFAISQTLSISPARKILQDAALGQLPGRFEVFLGYSSWVAGQLRRELSRGDWLHVPFCRDLVFDIPPEDRWLHAFESVGIAPYSFMKVKGGAQA